MKLAINFALSFLVLGLCLWLVWPDAHHRAELGRTLSSIELASFWPYLAGYLAGLALTHFFRAWRWNNLLRPIGVSLPPTSRTRLHARWTANPTSKAYGPTPR